MDKKRTNKSDVIKYLQQYSYRLYRKGDLINYNYIKNAVLTLKEGNL